MSRIEIFISFVGQGAFIGIRLGSILAAIVYFMLTGFNLLAFFYLAYVLLALAIGAIFGGVLGGFNGLLLGIITAFRFYRTVPSYYKHLMITLAILATLVVSSLVYHAIFSFYAYDNQPSPWLGLISGAITSCIAIYGAHLLTGWYIKTQQLPITPREARWNFMLNLVGLAVWGFFIFIFMAQGTNRNSNHDYEDLESSPCHLIRSLTPMSQIGDFVVPVSAQNVRTSSTISPYDCYIYVSFRAYSPHLTTFWEQEISEEGIELFGYPMGFEHHAMTHGTPLFAENRSYPVARKPLNWTDADMNLMAEYLYILANTETRTIYIGIELKTIDTDKE